MGLPWLRGHDRAKLLVGNGLFFFTVRMILLCLLLKIPVVLENPKSSRCWLTPILAKLIESGHLSTHDLDFCQFGERWRKPARLAAANIDLSSICKTCSGSFLQCSYTGKRHVQLKGTDNEGRFLTLIAQPYPFQLCSDLANEIFNHFRSLCG